MYMSCKFRLALNTLRYIRVDIVRGLSNVFLTDPIQGVCERERKRECRHVEECGARRRQWSNVRYLECANAIPSPSASYMSTRRERAIPRGLQKYMNMRWRDLLSGLQMCNSKCSHVQLKYHVSWRQTCACNFREFCRSTGCAKQAKPK